MFVSIQNKLHRDEWEHLDLRNKLWRHVSWLQLLTCWSWELGAQWCGLLGLCRVRKGHNPLMSVAQCSCPGSSETGTWYQSCRCPKTLDLRVERCLCYWFWWGLLKLFSFPKGEIQLFVALPPQWGQSTRSVPSVGVLCDGCSDPGVPAEEQFTCLPHSTALQMVFLLSPVSMLGEFWYVMVGTTCPTDISLFGCKWSSSPQFLNNKRATIITSTVSQTLWCFHLQIWKFPKKLKS